LIGSNLAEHRLSKGWEVFGVARKPETGIPEVRPVTADMLDPKTLRAALAGIDPNHVFLTTWVRRAAEEENIAANRALVRNLLAALKPSGSLRHVALVTNMGVTLAVYPTICRETGRPFAFPRSAQQWDGLTDVTDARILGRRMEWAASAEVGRNQAFNIVNGDISRWRWLWPRHAADFGIEAAPYPGRPTPPEPQLADTRPVWAKIGEACPRRSRSRQACVGLAYRPGARAPDRGRDRHDQEPPGRLPRIPADTTFVSGVVRQIADRAHHPGLMIGPSGPEYCLEVSG
jgi:putative NAD(P)-binding protein